jgi:hypothetical protein
MRWSAVAIVSGAFALLALGCAVTAGGGYGYDGGVGVGLDYYEPLGFDYGGWGPGYGVGPFRGGGHRPDRGGGANPPGHAYRPSAPSRSVPSIPSGPRTGGGRSSGGTHR